MATNHPNDLAERLAGDLYRRILDRDADQDGYAYVLDSLREGRKSVREHALEMVCSAEFAEKFLDGSDNKAAVLVLNRVLLGSVPDGAQLQHEEDTYQRLGREGYADMLTQSSEYQKRYGDDRVPGS